MSFKTLPWQRMNINNMAASVRDSVRMPGWSPGNRTAKYVTARWKRPGWCRNDWLDRCIDGSNSDVIAIRDHHSQKKSGLLFCWVVLNYPASVSDTALDTLRRFAVSGDIDHDDILNDLRKIEQSLIAQNAKKAKQSKITDFFARKWKLICMLSV